MAPAFLDSACAPGFGFGCAASATPLRSSQRAVVGALALQLLHSTREALFVSPHFAHSHVFLTFDATPKLGLVCEKLQPAPFVHFPSPKNLQGGLVSATGAAASPLEWLNLQASPVLHAPSAKNLHCLRCSWAFGNVVALGAELFSVEPFGPEAVGAEAFGTEDFGAEPCTALLTAAAASSLNSVQFIHSTLTRKPSSLSSVRMARTSLGCADISRSQCLPPSIQKIRAFLASRSRTAVTTVITTFASHFATQSLPLNELTMSPAFPKAF
mmetsp:Transcript_46236/g.104834  ORF Transcript_46236/g.104834 Transcript_46236/m.104834 type:complete len:270 (-) Transcript_46236:153-962(-)